MRRKIIVSLIMATIMVFVGCFFAAAEDAAAEDTAASTTAEENTENTGVSDTNTDGAGKYTPEGDNTKNTVKTAGMTEDEANALVDKIAEAVGNYADKIPAAKTAKEWILRNASNIIGFLMALSLLIATPAGSNIYKNAKLFIKKNVDGTLTTVEAWKNSVEKTLNDTSDQSKELASTVKELIKKYDEIADARAAADAAREKAEADLQAATEKMTAREEKTAATNQAMLASTLLLARTMTTVVQLSKALTQQQKDEYYDAYKSAMAAIKSLTDGAADGESTEGADEVQNN